VVISVDWEFSVSAGGIVIVLRTIPPVAKKGGIY
jgi:hypothetical protein